MKGHPEGCPFLSVFEKTVKNLDEIIVRYRSNTDDDMIRDSVIHRFKITYYLVFKTLGKYFRQCAFIVGDIYQMSFNEMIRTANQYDLLKSNLETWTEFREMRNLTSHTYDENIANKVVSIVPDFYEEVSFLLQKLKDTQNG